MVTIFSANWTIYNYTLKNRKTGLMNRNSTIITQTIISHLKQLNTKKTVTYVGVNQGSIVGQTCIYHPYTQSIYTYIPPINTINILYIPLIHTQSTCIYHPYAQSIYMYIPPYIHNQYTVYTTHIHNQYTVYTTHIHNQYTCTYHPYTQSINYIPPIYTINIHVHTTHIHNQYICT